jgi:hypothetical protein
VAPEKKHKFVLEVVIKDSKSHTKTMVRAQVDTALSDYARMIRRVGGTVPWSSARVRKVDFD